MSLNTDWIFGAENLLLLGFLVFLEIALSIDNFAGMRETLEGLPEERKKAIRSAASVTGLILRIALICIFIEFTLLVDPFVQQSFSIFGINTGKALFLTLGGTFLIFKAVGELRFHLSAQPKPKRKLAHTNALSIWLQLACVDLFLSLDSVIAALSMVNSVKLIVVAMILAHLALHLNWERIDRFFAKRSSMMTLTLAFVLLLGIVSLFRGLGASLTEETLLAALMFGVLLEALNLKDKHATVEVASLSAAERRRAGKTRGRVVNQAEKNRQTQQDATIFGATTVEPLLARHDSHTGDSFEQTRSLDSFEQTQSFDSFEQTQPAGSIVQSQPLGSFDPPRSFDHPRSFDRFVQPHPLDLFQEEICSKCQTRTHGIFPFCLTCGQARVEATALS